MHARHALSLLALLGCSPEQGALLTESLDGSRFAPIGAAFRADLPGLESEAVADSGGLTLTTPTASLTVRTTGVWVDGDFDAFERHAPVGVDGGVVYEHGGFEAWWATRGDALEHGWTLAEQPGDEVVLDVAIDGAQVFLRPDGRGAWLQDASGDVWRYDGLRAWDADGAPVSARMEQTADGVAISVGVSGATWPVTVDPVLELVAVQKLPISGEATEEADHVDFNGDGIQDTVTSDFDDYAYVLYGGMAKPVAYSGEDLVDAFGRVVGRRLSWPSGTSHFYQGIGDYNGDGCEDLISRHFDPDTGISNGAYRIHYGCSAPAVTEVWSSPIYEMRDAMGRVVGFGQDYPGLLGMPIGDYDGDGKADLLTHTSDLKLRLWRGGSRGYVLSAPMATLPYALYATALDWDFDGDGAPDFIVPNGTNFTLGTQTINTLGTAMKSWGQVKAVKDIDGDGLDEVMIQTTRGQEYLRGSASVSAPVSVSSSNELLDGSGNVVGWLSTGPERVRLGDIRGNGVTQAAYHLGGYLELNLTTDGFFEDSTSEKMPVGPGAGLVAPLGDVNADGVDDFSVVDVSRSAVWELTSIGSSTDTDGDGVDDALDCAPMDASRYPGATEGIGDGVDQDCDGEEICYVDDDGDGARTSATTVSADEDCADAGEALATADIDCDDTDAAILPGATEVPGDEVDQDCDGTELCFADADLDGWRTDAASMSADTDCSDAGEALASVPAPDCDDTDATVNPGVAEPVGAPSDLDCDGVVTCYEDLDDDGARTSVAVASSDDDCDDSGEAYASEVDGDCDDSDPSLHPERFTGDPDTCAPGPPEEDEGGGCSSTGAPPWLPGLAVPILLLGLRRRSSSRPGAR